MKFWIAAVGELAGAAALALAVVGGPFWAVAILFAACVAAVLFRRQVS